MTPDASPSRTSSRAQRIVHALAAACAWAAFLWAWVVVFLQRTSEQAVGSVIALAVFLIVMLLGTLGWVKHNLRIYARKGPRRDVPMVREDWSRDVLGRTVESDWPKMRVAPVVVVEASDEVKRYRVDEPSAAAKVTADA